MKIKKLFRNIPVEMVRGAKDIEITGISSHSKSVAPGFLFIAKKGSKYDGNAFIADAMSNGASAILTDIYNPFLKNVVQVIHSNVPLVEAAVAEQFYDSPSEKLFLVGTTGTNGKTTCGTLAKHLLDKAGKSCGIIGSLEYNTGRNVYNSSHTTPDIITIHQLLNEMVSSNCQAASLELSSHALAQGRARNLLFDRAIFTNLTPEHLDYHKTMKKYAEAKANLFEQLETQITKNNPYAIFNTDDKWSKAITKKYSGSRITYGIKNKADVTATKISTSPLKSTFEIQFKGKITPFSWNIPGTYNIYNCLAATALGLSMDIPLDDIAEMLSSFQGVPGRLEPVQNNLGINIFVDYAATPDALENVLTFLKSHSKQNIITVFGCGGDRDKSKRTKMGEISEKFSTMSILTSDNPRSEDPKSICKEIAKGFKSKKKFLIEEDREQAFRQAIEKAKPGDTLLIAGKGHEKFQIFSTKTVEFNDKEKIGQICQSLPK